MSWGGQATSQLANFEIKPGRHLQVVKLPMEEIDAAHYYIHVSGEPEERNPNFSETGAGQAELQYRPRHYVPIKVAIFDEKSTLARKAAYREAKAQGVEDLEEVEPAYGWVYRPEMQFSLFDLKVPEINRIDNDDNPHDIRSEPQLTFLDKEINLLYTLLEGEFPVLEPFGPGREMVFSLGEQEVRALVGEEGRVEFTNVEHLALLELEDFIAIRLYQNGDDENVLWEFAFEPTVVKNEEDE